MAYDEVMNKYERVASVVKTFIKGKHVQVVLGAMVIETGLLRCFLYNWLGSDEKILLTGSAAYRVHNL